MYHLSSVLNDSDWVWIWCRFTSRWLDFSNFGLLKKEDLWHICDIFGTRPPLTCEPLRTPPTLMTFLTLTLKPHYWRIRLYHHLVVAGLVDWQWTHTGRHCDILIAWWIYERKSWEKETFSVDMHLRVKEVSISSSVDYLTNLAIETRRRLLMDTNKRWWGWVMYISNPRHQYSPIEQSVNRLIDQLIYLSTDARNGWMDTSVGQ